MYYNGFNSQTENGGIVPAVFFMPTRRVTPVAFFAFKGNKMALTYKQKAFVENYLVDFNATQAAMRAGYSAKTAGSIGSENLKKPEIRAAIDEKIMAADEVLVRLSDIARGNVTDLMDVTSAGYTISLLVAGEKEKVRPETKLIKKIKQKVTTYLTKTEGGEDREIVETELELYNAQDALNTLGRYHKLFVDRQELTGADGGALKLQAVEAAIQRLYGAESDKDERCS